MKIYFPFRYSLLNNLRHSLEINCKLLFGKWECWNYINFSTKYVSNKFNDASQETNVSILSKIAYYFSASLHQYNTYTTTKRNHPLPAVWLYNTWITLINWCSMFSANSFVSVLEWWYWISYFMWLLNRLIHCSDLPKVIIILTCVAKLYSAY